MSTIHVVGGTTFDLLATGLPALPRNEEAVDEFTDTSLAHLPAPFVPTVGGNAGNLAFTVARLGAPTHLVTPLGGDLFGDWLRARLIGAGVTIAEVAPAETSVNVVATDEVGCRLSLFRPVTATTEDLTARATLQPIRRGDAVVLAGYPHPSPEALRAWAEAAGDAGAWVALDVGPPTARLTRSHLADVLPGVDVLLANELEFAGLSEGTGEQERSAAGRLAAEHELAVVVKRGARGATYVDRHRTFDVAAAEVPSGPTVGAGDAFGAGLVYALTDGMPPQRAVAFGTASAALVIAGGRGVLGAPDAAEVNQFLPTVGLDPARDEGAPYG